MNFPQAVILCGGLGTRLGDLTRKTPKPLLPVAGHPFLDTLLFEIGRHGIKDVLLLAGFAGERVEAYARSTPVRNQFGLRIEVAREPAPAGTGGALRQAANLLAPEFLLLNGDSWFDVNLLDLAVSLEASPDQLAVMALRVVSDASRYGVVQLQADRVAHMAERPEGPGPGLVNGGVYAMRRELVARLSDVCSLERDILPVLAQEGGIGARVAEGYFIDIGVPSDYQRAQTEISARKRRPAVFFDRDGVLNEDLGYVGEADRLHWIEGAARAIKKLNDMGWYAFVITNQAGVARGYYSEDQVRALHAHMNRTLAASGAHIDDFHYCPYHAEGTEQAYRRDSDWRKPAPGMILDLLSQWPVERDRSFVIGDKPSDVEAGLRAGIAGHLFPGGGLDRFLNSLLA